MPIGLFTFADLGDHYAAILVITMVATRAVLEFDLEVFNWNTSEMRIRFFGLFTVSWIVVSACSATNYFAEFYRPTAATSPVNAQYLQPYSSQSIVYAISSHPADDVKALMRRGYTKLGESSFRGTLRVRQSALIEHASPLATDSSDPAVRQAEKSGVLRDRNQVGLLCSRCSLRSARG